MNNTTRRHPRTLNEAFGPYTSQHISERRAPVPLGEASAGAVLAIVGGIAFASLLVHWLSAL